MNIVLLTGNLGQAPEVRDTKTTTVARFSLATNERFKDRDGERHERTDWHRVVAFGALAKTLEQLQAGDKVTVRGKLRTNTYEKNGEKRTAVEVHAAAVEFLVVKNWRDAPAAEVDEGDDDDIPF